jgi:periplasmic mercuric ion binding protein
MKRANTIFPVIVVSAMLFLNCKKETSSSIESKVKTTSVIAKAETTTFNIEGMKCAMGCAKVIETKLSSLDGVQKATVDFDKKTATIQYDAAKQTPEKLVETVEAVAGGDTYKVSNVKSSADKAMLYQVKQVINKGKKAKSKAQIVAEERRKSALVKGDKKLECCNAGKNVRISQRPDATL